MAKNLLIVESPAKARTIKKYLGPDFKVMASVGHLVDLPVQRVGVDLEDNFQPEYVTIKGKGKILRDLKKAGKEAQAIYLAPDPDREGEAIAWHIAQEVKGGDRKIFRVLFNELTAKAIREAVAFPQTLNRAKFESQQARRILDRLVGYLISPLLWTKVRGGLSAGRVQSVALKMICDREREIHAFESQEYWSLTAHLESEEPPPFEARLSRYDDKKIDLRTKEQTQKIISEVEDQAFKVGKVSRRKKRKNPPPPFITSLLQQEAYGRLGFPAKKTMSLAQNLYEGIDLGERGQIGLITYMRTDSFRLSDDAVSEVRDFISKTFGGDYLPTKPNRFKSRKGAQEAHEAIRPTSVGLDPKTLSPYLTRDQLALYSLIWKRFVSCQMKPAVLDQTIVEVVSGRATFTASGSVFLFKGFTAVYEEGSNNSEHEKNGEGRLPPLEEGRILKLIRLEPAQHFTQPPPRFSEAPLIKALEENGIGRPSTYATILANITGREYVSIEKRRFKPTELGFMITELLVKNFPDILDTAFTAQMETNLDKIERSEVQWTSVIEKFYEPFEKNLKKAQQEMRGEILTEIACSKCNRPMSIKSGRNGLFLACTGFPECKSTANFIRDDKGKIVPEPIPKLGSEEGACETCGRPMVVKKGKFGPFLACSGYPECKNTRAMGSKASKEIRTGLVQSKCNACGARMAVKVNRAGQRFLACENYPACTYTEPLSTEVPCPDKDCQGTLVERTSKKGRKFYGCNQYPRCRFAMWDEPFDDVCPKCGTRILGLKRREGVEPILVCRRKGCGFTKPLLVV